MPRRAYNTGMDATRFLGNHFLIALPGLSDPNFSRSVTLVCQHNDEGAMGLMLNRTSEYRLGDVLEQMQIRTENETLAAAPVLIGGPVQPERGFVLHDADEIEWDSTFRVSPALSLTTSRDILVAMARGDGPRRALITLGYAGWDEGQLESELQDNAWLTVQADRAILFETPLEQRWSASARLMGVDLSLLAGYAGHA
jgi:putative transcriptional regulator